MGKVIITEFVSLDGVMEAPEKWSLAYWNDDIAAFKDEEGRASEALLLGRRTYEGFAEAWPSRSGEYADRFNNQAKYVVTGSLETAGWNNSRILRPDSELGNEVRKLKERHDGDVVVHGSGALAQWLLSTGLADELRLLVYPLVRGQGKRLLENIGEVSMALKEARPVGSGVNLLIYEPAQA